ncbi:MAG: DMT family transporter [Actinobacteria bacterium]|nr:DMT family transporter [Actinomycetota bacterium]MBU1493780.1 DMT family transporter [Actinomycetota bacterium]MBU1865884.1 DMT family transporter [Actinomycetota bacterium]
MSHRILSTSAGTNREAFTSLDWVMFSAISLIWGSSFLLMDIGLDALQPGLITWMRVGLGAGVLLLFPGARKPIDPADRPRVLVLSVLWVGLPFTLFPVAQQYVDSAVAGMLNGAMPIFAAIFASAMLRRLPRGAQLIGLVIGFGGVILMSVSSGAEGSTEALGVGLILLATVCYGLSVNITTPLTQRYGSLPVMARMLALAAVWTAPLGFVDLLDSSFAWDSVLAVAAAGAIGTGLAFFIMGALVGRVGSTRGSFITYLIPVVALGLGVAFRGDSVSVWAVAGVGLAIVGALLASRRERTPSPSR